MSTQQVFLSYCRENLEEARQLREDLLNEGISVWWDQDVLPGTIWESEILIAIDECNAVSCTAGMHHDNHPKHPIRS